MLINKYIMKNKIFFSCLTFIIVVSIIVISSEVLLRLDDIWRHHDLPIKLSLFRENPYGTGSFRYKPNLNIATKINGQEVHIKTNSYGMPWREVMLQKPAGKKRIAFVGDSFTAGEWADSIENSFVGIFDSLLSDKKYEVLNFGVCGYGLNDEELIIREEVVKFHPDNIVLMIFNGNDFRDTYLGNHSIVSNGTLIDNVFIYEKKVPGELIPDIFRKGRLGIKQPELKESNHFPLNNKVSLRKYLVNHMATYRFLSTLMDQYILKPNTITEHENIDSYYDRRNLDKEFHQSKTAFTSHMFWSQTSYPDIAIRARDITLETLEHICEYLKKENIELDIVTIPYAAQVYVDKESSREYDINLPQKYVEAFARTHNILYFDLLPRLRAYVRNNKMKNIYERKDIHFNNEGHLVTGKLLFDWFKYQTRHST